MKLVDIAVVEADEQQPAEQTYVYPDEAEVAVYLFPTLQQKIEKLNKRARKLKMPELRLEIVKEYMKEVKAKKGDEEFDTGYTFGDKPVVRQIPYYTVKVVGDPPKVPGYKFMATVEHQAGGNIIRTVPGEEGNKNIKAFYEAKPDYCDHCKKVRRRIDTFIVKEEKTDKLRQIGRNCLADFLGGADPKAILWWFNNRDELFRTLRSGDEWAGGKGGRAEYFMPIEELLAVGAALVRKRGYMSAKKAQEKYDRDGMGSPTTAGDVRYLLFTRKVPPLTDADRKLIADGKPQPEDVKYVQDVLKWFNALPDEQKESNEFMHNLNVLVKSGKVNPRNVGYAVALFPVYAKAMDLIKPKGPAKSNEHIGQPGQKITPTKVKVIRTRMISGQFGTTQIVSMEDPAGNTLVWFNNSQNKMEEGKEYTIVGTIKKHDEFNGRKQTHLTRVKAQ